ncbi:MAG: His/Gly/Thr/Pro-type tRNA ligase C-terminal domain-containing protein [Anaerolineae bacterium]|nr:His/Gly/Thr/Pro-type tRNA ligase C-terminal domain-containing protein [Anaerolineae bacterium]
MRYDELSIQTHREAPANARSAGQSWLVRAGYISHSGQFLPLGERALARIRAYLKTPADFEQIGLLTLTGAHETYFPMPVGSHDLLRCPECGTAARAETARAKKAGSAAEMPAPLEKVLTPDCPTIESLAALLSIPTTKTAKALMFVSTGSPKSPDFGQTAESRETFDSEFIFVVIRGDMALSEAKLEALVGKFRLATEDEIRAVGAVPGYASPVGVKNARIIVDELIPQSTNLVAGANQAGYHLLNTNYGRDYSAEIVADLSQANPGDPCIECGAPLEATRGWVLASDAGFDPEKILFALAEAHNDEKGLTFPAPAAPFDIYLMQVPGKTLDTLPVAEELYQKLQAAGFSVLFDDRNERAGVKFNDADLLGCPIRITVGERGLQNGMAEIKGRNGSEVEQIPLAEIIDYLRSH